MKSYMFLYEHGHNYYPMNDLNVSSLKYLVDFFSGDYRAYDENLFHSSVNCYNASFVYNDLKNQMLYIGCSIWEIFEEINIPTDEEFPNYVNETNSCKMSVDNYLEFRQKWVQLKKELLPFALIYRDNNDWVDCKGFATQEEMEIFVHDAQKKGVH